MFPGKKIYKICTLCTANFCRSPVAEKIIQAALPSEYHIISAGLIDYYKFMMHQKSEEFLISIGFENTEHKTIKIDKNIVSEVDIILAMDIEIVKIFQKKFPSSSNKIFLLPSLIHSVSISDPINFNDSDYKHSMDSLKRACNIFCEKLILHNSMLK